MNLPARAVGRLAPGGPWVGFAPTLDDTYALVVGLPGGARRAEADPEMLLAMAIAYFEDALDPPSDELAATHGDIAALVRHVAQSTAPALARRRLQEAVDAIDDGLGVDVVIGRLTAALSAEAASDPVGRLVARARRLARED